MEQLVEQIAELVTRAARGDREAFAELVRRHERLALGVAWNRLGDFHAAQDIAQEAFVVAFTRIRELKTPGAFGPWVAQITARLAGRAQKQHPRFEPIEALAQLPAPLQAALPSEETARVLAAVTELPQSLQDVVILRYVEGHDVATIARLTERPLGTVTKQLSRAVRRLQTIFSEVDP